MDVFEVLVDAVDESDEDEQPAIATAPSPARAAAIRSFLAGFVRIMGGSFADQCGPGVTRS